MKNSIWKQYPHFFRDFDIKSNKSGNLYTLEYVGKDQFIPSFGHDWIKYSDCTLIARSISSMTNEEWIIHNELSDIPFLFLNDLSNNKMSVNEKGKRLREYYMARYKYSEVVYALTAKQFINLINIKVYPFNVSDFNNSDLDKLE